MVQSPSRRVITNVGKTFIKWDDKYFTNSSTLNKIFTKNILKVSYSYRIAQKLIKKTNKSLHSVTSNGNKYNCKCEGNLLNERKVPKHQYNISSNSVYS